MSDFTEEQIWEVWRKGNKDPRVKNHDQFRTDIAGAWMDRQKYGVECRTGWEIDHIYPESLGGGNEIDNLQPLQWQNNRSKGSDFPSFTTSVSSYGQDNRDEEIEHEISEDLKNKLTDLYSKA